MRQNKATEHCPVCKKPMAPVCDGSRPSSFRCLDCDSVDPLKADNVKRWLEGELGRELPQL
jgi:hypothetical protein